MPVERAGGYQMNKSELIEALALKKNITIKKSEEIIETIFISMSDALRAGKRIEVRGFGSFVIKHYKPYIGRNPMTGDAINVKSKKSPFFKVSKELKEKVDY
jgi:integration host factor subunit beta